MAVADANATAVTLHEDNNNDDSKVLTPSSPEGDGDIDIEVGNTTTSISSVNRGWSIRTNQGLLILPIKHNSTDNTTTNDATATVSNCCAICLEPYRLQESVTWSSDRNKCKHAFHTDCIVGYLSEVMTKKDNNNNRNVDRGNYLPCPICRETFLRLAREP